jgi:hypothetical protein
VPSSPARHKNRRISSSRPMTPERQSLSRCPTLNPQTLPSDESLVPQNAESHLSVSTPIA